MISELVELLRPISDFFKILLNPTKTLTKLIDTILLYTPVLASVIFIFYIVTGSKKVLSALSFVILVFILLKAAIVFDLAWLIVIVLVAVLIIRLIGGAL